VRAEDDQLWRYATNLQEQLDAIKQVLWDKYEIDIDAIVQAGADK
jgi:hypothetical protein